MANDRRRQGLWSQAPAGPGARPNYAQRPGAMGLGTAVAGITMVAATPSWAAPPVRAWVWLPALMEMMVTRR